MSRFRDEVRIIPWVAWAAAALVVFATFLLPLSVISFRGASNTPLDPGVRLFLQILVSVVFLFYALLTGYVYADAKRRGMRHVMWTLLAALVPNAIGIILYFVLREPILVECPACHLPARSTFAFCPHCGTSIAHACPRCRCAIEPGWSNCAYCGEKLDVAAPHAA